jgi:hypothetical protein
LAAGASSHLGIRQTFSQKRQSWSGNLTSIFTLRDSTLGIFDQRRKKPHRDRHDSRFWAVPRKNRYVLK